jgi:hypothetical protein
LPFWHIQVIAMTTSERRKWMALGAVSLACLVATASFAYRASRRAEARRDVDAAAPAKPVELSDALTRPHVLFRSTQLTNGYGRLALVPLGAPGDSRRLTPLACDRADYAGGRGVCLTADRGVFTTYRAVLFDDLFEMRHTIPLVGPPSRVRVSRDGAVAGLTVFVTGHSYAGGAFSTQSLVVDLQTGATLAELEQFDVIRDKQPFKQIDFNFWGITFEADPNRFYATLGTGGQTFLLHGDVRAKRATVLHAGVECPSLSPDGRRIVFKKRQTERGFVIWRLALLDLATMRERVLDGETRSVDDQVEWADDSRIMYALPDQPAGGRISVWMLDVDGGAATRVIADGESPSV